MEYSLPQIFRVLITGPGEHSDYQSESKGPRFLSWTTPKECDVVAEIRNASLAITTTAAGA